ncbi:MAG: serine acetyltransferase [Clostridia bacterium]|nr:serine acetyltransferase [Clostridia bacterium]
MKDRIREAVKASAEKIRAYSEDAELFIRGDCGLPDRAKVIEVSEKLRSLMFPGFFSDEFKTGGEYAYGYALTDVVKTLKKEMRAAFGYMGGCRSAEEQAEEACLTLIECLPDVQRMLVQDVEAAFDGDPAAKSRAGVVFSYPGLHAITIYRLAHVLYEAEVPFIPRIMTEHAHSVTGIDINAGAKIGSYFFIDHGTGVVIGETTVIGDFVKLYQGVTLGALSTRQGQKLKGLKRHPTIGNRVTIYSGASILGGETEIGDDCVIGGNAFVTSSVPPRTRVSVKSPELTFREVNKNLWEKA